jgi:hypothetical protein
MGRWSQRRLASSTPNDLSRSIAALTVAGQIEPDVLSATYDRTMLATSLSAPAFNSQPSAEVAMMVTQISEFDILLTMSGDVTGDTDLFYTGTTPGFKTPDTCSIT